MIKNINSLKSIIKLPEEMPNHMKFSFCGMTATLDMFDTQESKL